MKLVIDFGGMSTKITILTQKFEKKIEEKIKYPDLIEAEKLLSLVHEKVTIILKNENVESINISAPGIIDTMTGQVSGLSAIENWSSVNLKEEFSKYNLKVFCENDANCAIIAEQKFGNGINTSNFASIIIGTGIGGGLVLNNNIYKGSNFSSAEFGYCPFSFDNQYINYSLKASSYFLKQYFYELSGEKLDNELIFANYNKNKFATKAIDELVKNVALLLVNINFILDLELFLIGGGISANELFLKLLRQKVYEILDSLKYPKNVKIDKCKFLNDANLIGAYSLG